jgi:hypothetical protein
MKRAITRTCNFEEGVGVAAGGMRQVVATVVSVVVAVELAVATVVAVVTPLLRSHGRLPM